jgi:hypothetical protein
MSYLFKDYEFNDDISQWDVSQVENMREMFAYSPFQQDISSWNVTGKTNCMFKECPIPEYFKPSRLPLLQCKQVGAGSRRRRKLL